MQIARKIKSSRWFQLIDLNLFSFLVLFLNVKMPVKIAALLFFLVLNRKLFFDRNLYRQKFIWFYFSLICIALVNFALAISSLTVPYLITVVIGILFWLLCAGAALLISWYVTKTDTAKLNATITLFFIANAVVTFGQLLLIICDAGSINPYLYQGMRQKYFIGTGDLLTGITLDVSTTNAILNAFGIVYFLKTNKLFLVLLCMIVLLLTTSNFTNVLLLWVLVYIFIFQSTANQKSMVGVCILVMVIFMVKVSPQNDNYIIGTYNKLFAKSIKPIGSTNSIIPVTEKPDSILTAEQRKQKMAQLYLDSLSKVMAVEFPASGKLIAKPSVPRPNIHTEPYQRRRDTSLFQKELIDFATKTLPSFDTSMSLLKLRRLPGKIIGFQQTLDYLNEHPIKVMTGTGIGNFSSKLAYRATGLRIAGGYSKTMIYINEDFRDNHLSLYLHYFSKDREVHSVLNSPHAVYDQLIAEYGIAGVFAFIFLYIAWFIKRLKEISYGIPLLMILCAAFFVDYWYEQLSIVIIFELLMQTGLKETNVTSERS